MFYRQRIRPLGPWRTPWQADTLHGMLAIALLRCDGQAPFLDRYLEPWRAGNPPFVCSDALPAGHLPIPLSWKQIPVDPDQRKALKRARYLPSQFLSARPDATTLLDQTLPEVDMHIRTQATLGRDADTTADGDLYQRQAMTTPGDLDLWIHTETEDGLELFAALLERLTARGFGADAGTGYGAFIPIGDPQAQPQLVSDGKAASGILVLGTCQPAAEDPTTGCWESFVKAGRLGPGLGLDESQIHKRPQLMLRPGASFQTDDPQPRFGRTIPDDQLLPRETCTVLRDRDIEVAQMAITCAIPLEY